MLRTILIWAVWASLAYAGSSRADEAEIQALREQIRELSARLDRLEGRQRTAAAGTVVPPATSGAAIGVEDLDRRIDAALAARTSDTSAPAVWADRIRPSGDFRYMYEHNRPENSGDWHRHRMRARVGLQADVSETVRTEFGLASGSDQPTSANQTFGEGGSSKQINLDLAYVAWTRIPHVTFLAGKHHNPLLRVGDSELLWDGDWRPEGIAVKYDNGRLFANALGSWMESDSRRDNREFALGLQSGMRFALGNDAQAIVGGGYYEIESAGRQPFYGGDDAFFGNSFDPGTGTYLYDYQDVEAFAQLTVPVGGRPLRAFADWVRNLDADAHATGYEFGLRYGEARPRGSWEVGYSYRKVDADAVLGLLTSSDFANGGSDVSGSIFQGSYAFDDNWNLRVWYAPTEKPLRAAQTEDFDRLQISLNFRYQ